MAFTFQINNDVKFKHDEKLLAKAEGFRPEIKKERIHPTRIVEVIEDPLKLNGVGVTESDKNIDKIEERINNLFFENAGLVEQDATYLSNARHS